MALEPGDAVAGFLGRNVLAAPGLTLGWRGCLDTSMKNWWRQSTLCRLQLAMLLQPSFINKVVG